MTAESWIARSTLTQVSRPGGATHCVLPWNNYPRACHVICHATQKRDSCMMICGLILSWYARTNAAGAPLTPLRTAAPAAAAASAPAHAAATPAAAKQPSDCSATAAKVGRAKRRKLQVDDLNSQTFGQLKAQKDLALATALPLLREYKDKADPSWTLCWRCICSACAHFLHQRVTQMCFLGVASTSLKQIYGPCEALSGRALIDELGTFCSTIVCRRTTCRRTTCDWCGSLAWDRPADVQGA